MPPTTGLRNLLRLSTLVEVAVLEIDMDTISDTLRSRRVINYLGLRPDSGLCNWAEVQLAAIKAFKVSSQLSSEEPPHFQRYKIFADNSQYSVVRSRVMGGPT